MAAIGPPATDPSTGDALAFTGPTWSGIGALGGVLLVTGVALVFAGRRRKVGA